jgi:hypothetical protein
MMKTTRLHKINTEKENARMRDKNEKWLYKVFWVKKSCGNLCNLWLIKGAKPTR